MSDIDNAGDGGRAPVRCERPQPAIAIITIDRPERRNALNLRVKNLLADMLQSLAGEADLRVIILTGAGSYFVAGTDIGEMLDMTPTSHTLQATDRVFHALRASDKVLVAAVEGYALGGGCELALCCDLIVAGASARFGQPEIRVGIMPGAGGTQRLVRTIGKYQAMKLILTGEPVSAQQALAMGMVSDVVEDGRALDAARALAATIAGMPPLAVRAIREVMQQGQDVPLETALALERRAFQMLFDTQDQKEGMQAFLQKRKPVFGGC
ncbi:enoyl-CoA hydratase-related protein [Herbaspirillum sp. YR522]|uniref:enoyl-CoA hydratase-related protein n=1 Tax=Herbaspirillum sp. YR522 TaxID=1144342 RepID=UPI00026F7612|nr:enoyl-CoA hydratase-related protein [Herbaspirillum sp. YR522]EJN09991.1 enoyl-CoA hydratase/carnithine racemase [Herbaspirillum sp. YR522]